jgi:guanylate kinase
MHHQYHHKPFLIILSAPSGGGKSTILHRLLAECPDLTYSISYTTRPIRGTEVNGKSYFFVSETEFMQKVEQGDFLEYACVFGYWYGTSKSFIASCLEAGKHVIMDIDVQGARQISSRDFDIVRIFILPPTLQELRKRLIDRKTDLPAVIEKRIQTSKKEIACISEYDYLVINDELDTAVALVKDIIQAEELKTSRYTDVDSTFYRQE